MGIIVNGRNHACPSGKELRQAFHVHLDAKVVHHIGHRCAGIEIIRLGKPATLGFRHIKIRIHHLQRIQQVLLQKIAVVHPAGGFHRCGQDIRADAIPPALAGAVQQRQLRHFGNHLTRGTLPAFGKGFRNFIIQPAQPRRLYRIVIIVAIPGGHAEQLPDCQVRMLGIPELRQIGCHRGVQVQFAVLP